MNEKILFYFFPKYTADSELILKRVTFVLIYQLETRIVICGSLMIDGPDFEIPHNSVLSLS